MAQAGLEGDGKQVTISRDIEKRRYRCRIGSVKGYKRPEHTWYSFRDVVLSNALCTWRRMEPRTSRATARYSFEDV
jgi:hypothetical protein